MQKERVMLRAAGGIPYELTRGRVKRLNLHVRRDGTVALSIPLRTTLEAADDAYVIAEAEWIRAAQARLLQKRQGTPTARPPGPLHGHERQGLMPGYWKARSPPSKCA